MDQFAESCGVAGSAVLLDCRSHEWRAIPLPPDVELVVCHTGSPRHLDGSEYNLRRSQCEAAVAALPAIDPAIRSLRDVTPEALAAAGDRLDPVAVRRAEHVVTENARVRGDRRCAGGRRPAAVGRLFAESHASLRDRFEVSSPELDAMVEIATVGPGVIAARMTGAGFGGCTVNLVRPDAVEALRAAVVERYPARTGLTPAVLPVDAVDGAGRIGLIGDRAHRPATRRPSPPCTATHPCVPPLHAPYVAFRVSYGILRATLPARTAPSQSRSPSLVHVRRSNQPAPTAPSATRPTTVGWIAIIVFVFLAGLGADRRDRRRRRLHLARGRASIDPSTLTDYVLPEETVIYDRTGKIELARFGDAKREVVTFDQIPKVLLDATTAVEDKTFWDNAGFDPVAILSAGARARSAATAAARRRSPSSSSARGCSTRRSSRTRTGRPSASSRRSSSRSG